ncbi:MAG: CHAD domain-containing protein [Sphingomonadales bacterium]
MAFRLKASDPNATAAVRRIAREQIRAMLAYVDDQACDRHRAVHEVRKRCKKLRALLRLAGPSLACAKDEEHAVRDAARLLSAMRDAQVLIETLDHVVTGFAGQVDRRHYRRLRVHLLQRRDALAVEADGIDGALSHFRAEVAALAKRVSRWSLDETGFDAFAAGLKRSYRRGRKGLAKARAAPNAATLHDWRKQAKYHQAHAQLLRPIWPALLTSRQRAAAELGDLLGDDHDLAVFQGLLRDQGADLVSQAAIDRIGGLIESRHEALARQAWALGERLFAEKPALLVQRWHCYWRAARQGDKGLFC